MSVKFGKTISELCRKYMSKYDDAFAEFVYQWLPITDNEVEAKQTVQELVEIAQKICNRVRES